MLYRTETRIIVNKSIAMMQKRYIKSYWYGHLTANYPLLVSLMIFTIDDLVIGPQIFR